MKSGGIYLQMFSIHGLVRHYDMEMGRDADTGGQIKYVVELATALSGIEGVRQVDLFTRLIDDRTVSADYSIPVEQVNDKFRIVRIQCGGRKYMRKELLWPHLPEYVDKTIKFIKQNNMIPDIVHGHYADAGLVAGELSEIFGIPFIFTGHSLGISKLNRLLGEGMREEDIVKKFRINTRINAEEEALRMADLVVASTNQEVEEQYAAYENRETPRFSVIPPGIDIDIFYPYYHDMVSDSSRDELLVHARASVLQELNRFFTKPDKPIILALCRPDKRKNISGLIQAYGEDYELQAMANLAVFAGIRKNIDDKEENERGVLTEMLLLMDRYDLYGKMAIPKKHNFELEVPELYRITAENKGVFVNAALVEPFGLTLLEAAACGLPIVATNDGGPRDIIGNCSNGILVDPVNTEEIAAALREIIVRGDRWEKFSVNGIMNVRKHYTWASHAEKYFKEAQQLVSGGSRKEIRDSVYEIKAGKRLASLKYFLITDIDNTLIGEDNSSLPELLELLGNKRNETGFGVATGRTVRSAVEYLEKYSVPMPDVIISSVGTEIYYGSELFYDRGWDAHLSHKWDKKKIFNALSNVPFLEYQEEETQRKFKISYYMSPGREKLEKIRDTLSRARIRYNMIYSHDEFLDILPYRASKGKAIRYLSYKWEVALENIVVCGDSGNDEEMLRGEPMGVIVGNYSHELEKLRGQRKIFFSKYGNAAGILDGLGHYRFPPA